MLSRADKAWLAKAVRRILAEVIEQEARVLGGYDGATDVRDDEWAEEGKRRRPIGFRPKKRKS